MILTELKIDLIIYILKKKNKLKTKIHLERVSETEKNMRL